MKNNENFHQYRLLSNRLPNNNHWRLDLVCGFQVNEMAELSNVARGRFFGVFEVAWLPRWTIRPPLLEDTAQFSKESSWFAYTMRCLVLFICLVIIAASTGQFHYIYLSNESRKDLGNLQSNFNTIPSEVKFHELISERHLKESQNLFGNYWKVYKKIYWKLWKESPKELGKQWRIYRILADIYSPLNNSLKEFHRISNDSLYSFLLGSQPLDQVQSCQIT